MNEGTKRVALWVRDTLPHPESKVLLGRHNFERKDFETDYIVVDALGAGKIKGNSVTYDDVTEEEKLHLLYSFPATLNFYGDGAFARATKLVALRRSERSRQKQKEHNIVVNNPESITDVKALTGQQYGERIEVVLQAEFIITEVVETLRIDTAIIDEIRSSP